MLHCNHFENLGGLLSEESLRLIDVGEVVEELTSEDLVLGELKLLLEGSLILILLLLLLLFLHQLLVLLIYQLLLPLNVLKHIFALRKHHVVWEHFGILFIELKHPRQPFNSFSLIVDPL